MGGSNEMALLSEYVSYYYNNISLDSHGLPAS